MKAVRILVLFALGMAVLAGSPAQSGAEKKGLLKAPGAATATSFIDINSASADVLKSLPGIGEAYAGKIIPHVTYESIKGQDRTGSSPNISEARHPGLRIAAVYVTLEVFGCLAYSVGSFSV